MKKILIVVLALLAICSTFFLMPSPTKAQGQAELEKNRLRSDIANLENQRSNSPNKQHTEFLDRSISAKKQRLQELESNPDQYFHNQDQRRQDRPHGGVAINPQTGEVMPVVK